MRCLTHFYSQIVLKLKFGVTKKKKKIQFHSEIGLKLADLNQTKMFRNKIVVNK